MSETDTPDCPLCMETFEIDDLHFYPCSCGYQICRFCWHRIRTDENGLCPACRKAYSEDPAMYRPLSQDEIQKIKKERKQKDVQHRQKISANRQHLSNIRVIQKHLVFVVGLSNKLADADILRRPEYFGKYGKILKIVINPNTNYAGPQGPSASAYITYTREQDALKAILSINNTQPPLKIRASLGTTKYCTHYLRNQACPKTDCMYLHDVGDQDASFTKEDMQAGKHQLFEKNLLDNYIASVQQNRSLKKSVSETSESDQYSHHSQEEDWTEEVETNVDSVLPSNASWGSSKDQHINKMANANREVEYPELESTILSVSTASPKITHMASVQVPTVQPTSSVQKPLTVSETAPKEEELPPENSYSWSSESKPVRSGASPIPITDTTPAYSWPTISDLGLTDLKINPSDDELGFDPFNECKSALEDLMESEKKQGVTSTARPTPSFSWDSFWPSNYTAANQNPMSHLTSYSLFGAQQQMRHPQMAQYRPTAPQSASMNPYPPTMQSNPMQINPPNSSAQFRFMPPTQQSIPPLQRFPAQPQQQQQNQILQAAVGKTADQLTSALTQDSSAMKQQQLFQNHAYLNQFRYNQTSQQASSSILQTSQLTEIKTSTVSVTSVTSTVVSTGLTMSADKNWQDGLRALLPNINISFSSQSQYSGTEAVKVTEVQNSVTTPPPGFVGFNAKPILEKASRPPPPPGFNKPATEQVFSPTSQPPPPGILNVPNGVSLVASTQQPVFSPSASVATKVVPQLYQHQKLQQQPSQQQQSVINNSQTSDDPSILWSKVLADKPKEIETSEMNFPLPGESMKSGSNQASHPVQLPVLNLTSWNTIVSGNQSQKLMHPKMTEETLREPAHPLQILAKDTTNKTQKPSPIFGNQQKQSIKKPTATVKPLKCTDGFTPVQNSRQSHNMNPGSRVSELDDFTADIVIPHSSGFVTGGTNGNTSGDFPVLPNVNGTSKTAKKKKKKAKEAVEHVSEIVVGRVEAERPPVTIFDDERPKKGKNKKLKIQQKASPPQQRKSPPLIVRQQSKELNAPIRILKTDGNLSGVTTPSSPVQAMATGEASKTPLADHEIVSRLTESTEKLLKNVLYETEAIKSNTEQISKDLKSALEKCKESSLSLSDLEKINLLLTPGKLCANELDDSDLVDTTDLERQVESARREAKMLEARLNDVIRKNMASELETLKRNTKGGNQ